MPPGGPIDLQQLSVRLPALERQVGMLQRQVLGLKRRLYPLEGERRLAAAGKRPRFPVEFRSQFGEDAAIVDLLGWPLEGFFIEVGAFDGYDLSVTYALEAMGWTGLLIEAIPERAEQCRTRRPGSRVVHGALSRPGAPAEMAFTVVDDHYGGMLSYLTAPDTHKAQIAQNKQTTRTVNVPVTTMDALLAQSPPPNGEIDAAVLDVEGGELDLLKGFDLIKHRPKVLIIEDNTLSEQSPLGRMMAAQPYIFLGWLEVSRVYLRQDLSSWRTRMFE